VARLLPPEGAALEVVAPEVGTVAGDRLEPVITTASLSKAGKSAWCRREHGVYAAELANWRAGTTPHRRRRRPCWCCQNLSGSGFQALGERSLKKCQMPQPLTA
jgi:hypothetical protein